MFLTLQDELAEKDRELQNTDDADQAPLLTLEALEAQQIEAYKHALALIRAGDRQEAERVLKQIIEEEFVASAEPDSRLGQVRALCVKNYASILASTAPGGPPARPSEALRWYGRLLLDEGGGDAADWEGAIVCAMEAGNLGAARSLAESAALEFPVSLRVASLLHTVLAAIGDDMAAAALRRAVPGLVPRPPKRRKVQEAAQDGGGAEPVPEALLPDVIHATSLDEVFLALQGALTAAPLDDAAAPSGLYWVHFGRPEEPAAPPPGAAEEGGEGAGKGKVPRRSRRAAGPGKPGGPGAEQSDAPLLEPLGRVRAIVAEATGGAADVGAAGAHRSSGGSSDLAAHQRALTTLEALGATTALRLAVEALGLLEGRAGGLEPGLAPRSRAAVVAVGAALQDLLLPPSVHLAVAELALEEAQYPTPHRNHHHNHNNHGDNAHPHLHPHYPPPTKDSLFTVAVGALTRVEPALGPPSSPLALRHLYCTARLLALQDRREAALAALGSLAAALDPHQPARAKVLFNGGLVLLDLAFVRQEYDNVRRELELPSIPYMMKEQGDYLGAFTRLEQMLDGPAMAAAMDASQDPKASERVCIIAELALTAAKHVSAVTTAKRRALQLKALLVLCRAGRECGHPPPLAELATLVSDNNFRRWELPALEVRMAMDALRNLMSDNVIPMRIPQPDAPAATQGGAGPSTGKPGPVPAAVGGSGAEPHHHHGPKRTLDEWAMEVLCLYVMVKGLRVTPREVLSLIEPLLEMLCRREASSKADGIFAAPKGFLALCTAELLRWWLARGGLTAAQEPQQPPSRMATPEPGQDPATAKAAPTAAANTAGAARPPVSPANSARAGRPDATQAAAPAPAMGPREVSDSDDDGPGPSRRHAGSDSFDRDGSSNKGAGSGSESDSDEEVLNEDLENAIRAALGLVVGHLAERRSLGFLSGGGGPGAALRADLLVRRGKALEAEARRDEFAAVAARWWPYLDRLCGEEFNSAMSRRPSRDLQDLVQAALATLRDNRRSAAKASTRAAEFLESWERGSMGPDGFKMYHSKIIRILAEHEAPEELEAQRGLSLWRFRLFWDMETQLLAPGDRDRDPVGPSTDAILTLPPWRVVAASVFDIRDVVYGADADASWLQLGVLCHRLCGELRVRVGTLDAEGERVDVGAMARALARLRGLRDEALQLARTLSKPVDEASRDSAGIVLDFIGHAAVETISKALLPTTVPLQQQQPPPPPQEPPQTPRPAPGPAMAQAATPAATPIRAPPPAPAPQAEARPEAAAAGPDPAADREKEKGVQAEAVPPESNKEDRMDGGSVDDRMDTGEEAGSPPPTVRPPPPPPPPLAHSPDSPQGRAAIGRGIDAFLGALKIFPDEWTYRYRMAELEAARGDAAAALEHAGAACDLALKGSGPFYMPFLLLHEIRLRVLIACRPGSESFPDLASLDLASRYVYRVAEEATGEPPEHVPRDPAGRWRYMVEDVKLAAGRVKVGTFAHSAYVQALASLALGDQPDAFRTLRSLTEVYRVAKRTGEKPAAPAGGQRGGGQGQQRRGDRKGRRSGRAAPVAAASPAAPWTSAAPSDRLLGSWQGSEYASELDAYELADSFRAHLVLVLEASAAYATPEALETLRETAEYLRKQKERWAGELLPRAWSLTLQVSSKLLEDKGWGIRESVRVRRGAVDSLSLASADHFLSFLTAPPIAALSNAPWEEAAAKLAAADDRLLLAPDVESLVAVGWRGDGGGTEEDSDDDCAVMHDDEGSNKGRRGPKELLESLPEAVLNCLTDVWPIELAGLWKSLAEKHLRIMGTRRGARSATITSAMAALQEAGASILWRAVAQVQEGVQVWLESEPRGLSEEEAAAQSEAFTAIYKTCQELSSAAKSAAAPAAAQAPPPAQAAATPAGDEPALGTQQGGPPASQPGNPAAPAAAAAVPAAPSLEDLCKESFGIRLRASGRDPSAARPWSYDSVLLLMGVYHSLRLWFDLPGAAAEAGGGSGAGAPKQGTQGGGSGAGAGGAPTGRAGRVAALRDTSEITDLFVSSQLDRVRQLYDSGRSLVNHILDPIKREPFTGEAMRPVHVAAGMGHMDLLTWLLDHGSDAADTLDGKCNPPLYYAVAGGHGEAVAMLLDRGATPDAPITTGPDAGKSLASEADFEGPGAEALQRWLADRDANADQAGPSGRTPPSARGAERLAGPGAVPAAFRELYDAVEDSRSMEDLRDALLSDFRPSRSVLDAIRSLVEGAEAPTGGRAGGARAQQRAAGGGLNASKVDEAVLRARRAAEVVARAFAITPIAAAAEPVQTQGQVGTPAGGGARDMGAGAAADCGAADAAEDRTPGPEASDPKASPGDPEVMIHLEEEEEEEEEGGRDAGDGDGADPQGTGTGRASPDLHDDGMDEDGGTGSDREAEAEAEADPEADPDPDPQEMYDYGAFGGPEAFGGYEPRYDTEEEEGDAGPDASDARREDGRQREGSEDPDPSARNTEGMEEEGEGGRTAQYDRDESEEEGSDARAPGGGGGGPQPQHAPAAEPDDGEIIIVDDSD